MEEIESVERFSTN